MRKHKETQKNIKKHKTQKEKGMNKGTGAILIFIICIVGFGFAGIMTWGLLSNQANGLNQLDAPEWGNTINVSNQFFENAHENANPETGWLESDQDTLDNVDSHNESIAEQDEAKVGVYAEALEAKAEVIEKQGEADNLRLTAFGFIFACIGVVVLLVNSVSKKQ